MKTIRKTEELIDANLIPESSKATIEKVVEQFSVSITPQISEVLNHGSCSDKEAMRQQFVPNELELITKSEELSDPIGDDRFTTVKGVVHRYPDRCLLMPLTTCPVYCRFCFRREKVGNNSKSLSKHELEAAFTYIADHKEIWEVILTGGDPFMLKPHRLAEILLALQNIEHVDVVRIHTRVPVVDSKKINEELIKALKIKKAVYVALHANHPGEMTKTAKDACARIIDAGIPMLSQTVLLKGINDKPEVMGELMRTFVRNRIKPYYLHHADLAKGTGHFRTSIKEGQDLMRALRGRYSGLCLPTYVLEIPGGFGKIPIGHNYMEEMSMNENDVGYSVEDYLGAKHFYTCA